MLTILLYYTFIHCICTGCPGPTLQNGAAPLVFKTKLKWFHYRVINSIHYIYLFLLAIPTFSMYVKVDTFYTFVSLSSLDI